VIKLLNCDCMDYMKTLDDNAFDLAIVDPPYGMPGVSAPSRIKKYGKLQIVSDVKPNRQYFKELFRVSKNQIIWGYNHLSDMLPATSSFIFWHKHQPVKTYADGELAWSSFLGSAKCFDYPFFGANNKIIARIHPTQKPIKLYDWLLANYAKEGDKILDTHLGSGSSAIAAHYAGHDFVGCELDKDYYEAAKKRFDDETRQKELFG